MYSSPVLEQPRPPSDAEPVLLLWDVSKGESPPEHLRQFTARLPQSDGPAPRKAGPLRFVVLP